MIYFLIISAYYCKLLLLKRSCSQTTAVASFSLQAFSQFPLQGPGLAVSRTSFHSHLLLGWCRPLPSSLLYAVDSNLYLRPDLSSNLHTQLATFYFHLNILQKYRIQNIRHQYIILLCPRSPNLLPLPSFLSQGMPFPSNKVLMSDAWGHP